MHPRGRRAFLVTLSMGVLAARRPSEAQAVRTARVAWVGSGPARGATPEYLDAVRSALRERGWIEGRNLTVAARWGNRDEARDLAVELSRSRPDVFVAQGPMVFGVHAAVKSVPIVFGVSGDPVEAGLVSSLSRPGGMLTGISLMSFELMGKRLELLKEALPRVSRIAVIANPAHAGEQSELRETESAARRLGLTVHYVPVRSPADFDAAFEAITRERAEAIVAFPDGLIMSQARAVATFAASRRLPAMSGWALFAEQGNLMSYGPNLDEAWRQAGDYVDKILRGARAADLPVAQPTKIELVLNLKTAKALGLTLPPALLARAERTID
jgi:putative tryptophan/tyrosine transport system substrate-binding protein